MVSVARGNFDSRSLVRVLPIDTLCSTSWINKRKVFLPGNIIQKYKLNLFTIFLCVYIIFYLRKRYFRLSTRLI
jgi:hypothetical protein